MFRVKIEEQTVYHEVSLFQQSSFKKIDHPKFRAGSLQQRV